MIYTKVFKGIDLKDIIIDLPAEFTDKDLEVTIKPLMKRSFDSLSVIKIDTQNFKFNRDEANER